MGDAGYFKDPLTAHGMTDALRDAELPARAATDGWAEAFSEYEAVRDEQSMPLMDVTSEIASFEWTLGEAKPLHLKLAKTTSEEVELIRAWDAEVAAA